MLSINIGECLIEIEFDDLVFSQQKNVEVEVFMEIKCEVYIIGQQFYYKVLVLILFYVNEQGCNI